MAPLLIFSESAYPWKPPPEYSVSGSSGWQWLAAELQADPHRKTWCRRLPGGRHRSPPRPCSAIPHTGGPHTLWLLHGPAGQHINESATVQFPLAKSVKIHRWCASHTAAAKPAHTDPVASHHRILHTSVLCHIRHIHGFCILLYLTWKNISDLNTAWNLNCRLSRSEDGFPPSVIFAKSWWFCAARIPFSYPARCHSGIHEILPPQDANYLPLPANGQTEP